MNVAPLTRCPMCDADTGPSIVAKDGRQVLSGQWAFHMLTTHGLPVEITELKAREQLKEIWQRNGGTVKDGEQVWLKSV